MKRCSLLIIVAIALAACAGAASPSITPPVSPVMTPANSPVATPLAVAGFSETSIVYQRAGGFAGTSDKWTIYPTGRIAAGDGTAWQVPPEKVAPLFKLVESPAFKELNAKYAPAGTCNDCYTHTLTVFGPGEPQRVTFVDGADLPPAIQQVLPELNAAIAPPAQ